MDERNGTWRPGAIVWREVVSLDLEKTTAFYGALLGWTHHDSPGGKGVYRHFTANGTSVAGGWQIGSEMQGVASHWAQYISVDDVDRAVARVTELGGRALMGPMDLPKVGRMAVVADPQGATFNLFRDLKGDAPAGDGAMQPGTFCWESLQTTDKRGAVAFYTGVVPQLREMDWMGNLTLARGDDVSDGVADIDEAPPGAPAQWVSHVIVSGALAASRDKAVELGATVLMPEVVVPQVGKMAIILDPLGATISLFEPEPRAGG